MMVRDAALMICDLNYALVTHGYGTQDGHPWNVLFDFTEPRFVDFGSIVPIQDFTGRWVDEWCNLFRRCWLTPLSFMSIGYPTLARCVNKALDVDEPIDSLLASRWLSWFPWWYRGCRRLARKDPTAYFRAMRNRIQTISPPMRRTEWSKYFRYTGYPVHDDVEHYNRKARTIFSLLQRLKPRTVLDIGANKGWYSILAARLGAEVVSFDTDEECVNSLYLYCRSAKHKVLPLVIDFTIPTPRHGRKVEFPSAQERLACEVSLALALVHHLVFSAHMGFERIAQLLAGFTTGHAIVEFVPARDKFVAEWMRPGFEWYTMDNFIKAMGRTFTLEAVFDSDPPRQVLLFRKRSMADIRPARGLSNTAPSDSRATAS
ncbi:MAG: hypothetical protein ACRDFW_02230 [bacterium]